MLKQVPLIELGSTMQICITAVVTQAEHHPHGKWHHQRVMRCLLLEVLHSYAQGTLPGRPSPSCRCDITPLKGRNQMAHLGPCTCLKYALYQGDMSHLAERTAEGQLRRRSWFHTGFGTLRTWIPHIMITYEEQHLSTTDLCTKDP